MISWSASLGIYVWTGERAVLNQHIFKVVFDKCEVDALVEYMDTYISKYLSNSLVENCKIFYNEDISTQVGKLYSSYDIFRMTFLVYTEEEMMQAYQEIKAVLNEFQQKNILKKMKRKLPI